jgi:cytoskeletal protein CcmA (bactofilin family)
MAGKKFSDLGSIKAFLGTGTEFEGLLAFDGTVRIDGIFKGEVDSEDCLIIGEGAVVEAEIRVGRLVVMGKLTGNVKATSKVEISSSGYIIGDIVTAVIMIEEGANLEGNISMHKGEDKGKSSKPQQEVLVKNQTNEAVN